MKPCLAVFAALAVLFNLAMAQEPIRYAIANNIATAKIAARDANTVWTATQKVLLSMRWSTELAERGAGKIVAKQSYTTMATLDKADEDMPRVEILLTADGDGVAVMARWYIPGGGLKFGWGSARKKFYKRFFDALGEALK